MIKKKRKIIVGLCLLVHFSVSFVANAYTERIINDIDQGSCWVGKKEEGVIRIASFNDGIALPMSRQFFQMAVKKIKNKMLEYGEEFNENDLEVFLFCGAYGSSLIINSHSHNYGICVWMTINDADSVELNHIGVNPENITGPCDGKIVGKLIITISKEVEDPNTVISKLSKDYWKDFIDRISLIGRRSASIYLNQKYFFQEKIVKEEIENKFSDIKFIDSIEYDSYHHYIGEFIELELFFSN